MSEKTSKSVSLQILQFLYNKKWNIGNKEGKISVKGLSVNEPMVFLEVDNHLLGKMYYNYLGISAQFVFYEIDLGMYSYDGQKWHPYQINNIKMTVL